MATKDDVERARHEGYEEGRRDAFVEATKREELQGDWPLSVVNVLRLLDGMHRRGVPAHSCMQIVEAWIAAHVRPGAKDNAP